MRIRDIVIERRKLEKEIAGNVSRLVEDFKQKTGVSPHSIYIGLTNVDMMSEILPQYVVNSATVDIRL